ncbi:MAG TPA: Wzz/FepE/Etk N-terminal domain-containing protein [Anaerolineales bacterium]|nr:Wzz/FepE/Etk N-terminal domain-containing protein [Anaerolineales bacterium]
MAINDYLRIFVRRGWIILLLSVVTAISAFVFSKLQTPIYESTVNILVQPARPDFGLAQSAKILLGSYVAYLNTNNRAQEVINTLQLDTTPDALRSGVRMREAIDTFLITIEVQSTNGDLANDIARTWADVLVQWRNDENQKQRLEDRVSALVLDEPRYSQVKPRTMINTLAGALIGLLLGAVAVFAIEYIESGIVRSRQDIERFLDMPTIGAIPPQKSS